MIPESDDEFGNDGPGYTSEIINNTLRRSLTELMNENEMRSNNIPRILTPSLTPIKTTPLSRADLPKRKGRKPKKNSLQKKLNHIIT